MEPRLLTAKKGTLKIRNFAFVVKFRYSNALAKNENKMHFLWTIDLTQNVYTTILGFSENSNWVFLGDLVVRDRFVGSPSLLQFLFIRSALRNRLVVS